MRGEILYYESGADVGLIRSADGAHYRFRRADLGEGQSPIAGAFIEFTPRDAEWAAQIVVKGVDGPPPEKLDIWGYFAKCMRMSFNGAGRARATHGILELHPLLVPDDDWRLPGACRH